MGVGREVGQDRLRALAGQCALGWAGEGAGETGTDAALDLPQGHDIAQQPASPRPRTAQSRPTPGLASGLSSWGCWAMLQPQHRPDLPCSGRGPSRPQGTQPSPPVKGTALPTHPLGT